MMPRRRAFSTLIAPGLLAIGSPLCGPALAGAQTADRALMHRVVDSLAAVVASNYVVPDTGRLVAEHLRARLRAGAYDEPRTFAQLADRLTVDLKAVNGDRHLYVNYTGAEGPQPSRAGGAGPQMVMRRRGDPVPSAQLLAARRANYDVSRVERLPGNVGYLALNLLSARGSDEIYRVIDAAMAVLERTDAMIIDLRRTPGGEPRVSDYVASYFFGPDSVRTLNSYSRRMNLTMERWTRPVAGNARPDIPVYVLVGMGSASGAEDLAFIFKQTGRGTLVGGRTAGAGRPTRVYPVRDGFVASVSEGRTFDPRTGKEWERTGIEPDVAAGEIDALTVAHLHALEKLGATTSDSDWRRTLLQARAAVAARAKPVAVPAARLASYAGSYDVRVVEARGEKLYYRRDTTRVPEELTPLPDGAFALGEATRVEFVREGGRVTALRMITPGAPLSTFPRTH